MGISGSPRIGSNSEIFLDHTLKPFRSQGWEIKKNLIRNLTIKPRIVCDICRETGECAIKDDMAQVYCDFEWCNVLIIASPVYYRNVSAQLLALLQRYYAKHPQKILSQKVGGVIAVGRSTGGGGQSIVVNILYTWMLSSGMICVPGELNGLTASADKTGDILNQPKRLNQAEILGENMLKLFEK
ncbi:MAG: flavodoxin family protein [Promethearchaeota archaeon]